MTHLLHSGQTSASSTAQRGKRGQRLADIAARAAVTATRRGAGLLLRASVTPRNAILAAATKAAGRNERRGERGDPGRRAAFH